MKSANRRSIPAVNRILDSIGPTDLPRPLVIDLIRSELAVERTKSQVAAPGKIVEHVQQRIAVLRRSRLQKVINATGIIVHTNLGRAPLATEAADAVRQIAAAYGNLEQDLSSGARGRRAGYVEHAVAVLCGAEAATIVNNCAAALVLITNHLTRKKREVIISRGEMVQIGGGFRIADILEGAGARLREVGSTNKTTIADYIEAVSAETAFVLRVHRSNFFMSGFVASAAAEDLAKLAKKSRIPFVHDLGSGALFDTRAEGLEEHEPTVREAIKQGADLVCFSGDKLLGGPQAGIIVGRKRAVDALRREPLLRALRCDKLVLAALQTTVDLHLNSAETDLPVVSFMRTTKDELRARAAAMLVRLRGLPVQISIGRGSGNVGGGSLAQSTIPSVTLDIVPEQLSANDFAARLRSLSPPIIAYIAMGSVKLDLRTVFPDQDDIVVDGIRTASAPLP
ncbi:MAG: L-seryl-tRNA(Sec) selenium transferase [Chthoniobacterales bacterium]